MWKHKSITIKFISLTSLLTILLVAALSMTIISTANKAQLKQAQAFSVSLKDEQERQARLLRDNVLNKGDILSALLVQTAAGLISEYDHDTLKVLAQGVVQDNDIAFVTFFDTDGEALTDASEEKSDLTVLKTDIVYEEEKVGSLVIGLDLASVDQTIQALTKRIDQVVHTAHENIFESQRNSIWQTISYALIGVILLCLAIYFSLRRLVTAPVNRIAAGLSQGATAVSSASGKISTSSRSLAEGSSENAASIEETSSSLEEMSSMTKQNADNSRQAEILMQEVNGVISSASNTMDDVTVSMQNITKTSQETQNIVKTIDEIAFQTNLLALNAAVEAARAGEAGAGFAVVADEVRNLAIRAADAAQNTSELIQDSGQQIQEGADLVYVTNKAFGKVAQSAEKVTGLVGEIAAASSEQAQGIGQVNDAVNEMDRAVQQSAVNAEESASVSQQMNVEADKMKTAVAKLIALVEGSKCRQPDKSEPLQIGEEQAIGSEALFEPAMAADDM